MGKSIKSGHYQKAIYRKRSQMEMLPSAMYLQKWLWMEGVPSAMYLQKWSWMEGVPSTGIFTKKLPMEVLPRATYLPKWSQMEGFQAWHIFTEKLWMDVRVSPVALQLGSEMDPYRRDLTNIPLSYLVSDSFGPVLGARAWSCKTANNYLGLSQLQNTLETFGGRCLRLPPRLSMFCITFLLYSLLGLTILNHIYSSFL